jgi:hypothetical protein
MRTFITAMAIALLAVAVPAQAIAKGKRQQQDAPKAEDQAKKRPPRKHTRPRSKAYQYLTKSQTLGKP